MAVEQQLNGLANSYVKLVLGLGLHEDGYVDAYYGDESLKAEAASDALDLQTIIAESESLAANLAAISIEPSDEILNLRREFLYKQTQSIVARAKMNAGETWSFDEESLALYDTQSPSYDEAHYQDLIARLKEHFSGSETLQAQYFEYQKQFVIPKDCLDDVFKAAITEARTRTKQYTELSDNEEFVLEYVNNKVWSGYNWYQGNSRSLIQINTDLPIYIDRAIDLAAHEGYPGHHVYNSLLDKHLYRGKGWLEFSIYPLFSPQSVIAEGTANFGIDIVFPKSERVEFEKKVLFPLAGIDPSLTEQYYEIHGLMHSLNYVNNEVGRGYFSGQFDKVEALRWLQDYLLYEPARAEQRLKFLQANRSYVINYNWGQDLVGAYIDHHTQDDDSHEHRWKVFVELLSSPRLPSGLAV